MNRWYRQSLPPRSLAIILAGLVIAFDVLILTMWIAWRHFLDAESSIVVFGPGIGGIVALSVIAAVVMALFRIVRFPRSDYENWLTTTPWQTPARTPFGPWHPVIHDAVPITSLTLLVFAHVAVLVRFTGHPFVQEFGPATTIGMLCALPGLAFLAAWGLLALTIAFPAWSGATRTGAFWIMALIYTGIFASPVISVSALVASLVAALLLTKRRMDYLLSTLPHRNLIEVASLDQPAQNNRTSDHHQRVSQNYERLSPDGYTPGGILTLEFLRPHAYAICAFLTLVLAILPLDRKALILVFPAVGLAALIRLLIYTERTSSHLGITARWGTGKYIIPAYDQVCIPSLLMVASATLFLVGGLCHIIPLLIAWPLTVVVPLLVCLRSGPDYSNWSLTAPMSMTLRPPARNTRTQQRAARSKVNSRLAIETAGTDSMAS